MKVDRTFSAGLSVLAIALICLNQRGSTAFPANQTSSSTTPQTRRLPAPSPSIAKLLAAAHAEAEKHTPWRQEYREMAYPGGDVPITEGVCTDFVVRAFRVVGLDLQKTLHEDRVAHPEVYPTKIWTIKKPDANIDHRRCQNLTVWFKRFATSQTLKIDLATIDKDWQPGDVVFFAQTKTEYPTHVAIVSDGRAPDGMPLLLDNYPPFASENHRLDDFLPIHSHHRMTEENLRKLLAEKPGLPASALQGSTNADRTHR